jgi:hypothetical protein
MTNPSAATEPRASHAIGFGEHLAFFDTNQDRKISVVETQRGLERLGLGHLLTVPGALFIHAGVASMGLLGGQAMSPTALPLPDTGFVRHPDTDLVDAEGEFVPARLDAVFAKYARTFPGEALTLSELLLLTQARVLRHTGHSATELLLLPSGAVAAAIEWTALWWMAGEYRGAKRVLHKQAVQRFYTDPHFFHDVAKHIATEREARAERVLGRVRNFMQKWLI